MEKDSELIRKEIELTTGILKRRGFLEPVVEEINIENMSTLSHAPLDTRIWSIELHPKDIAKLKGVTLKKMVHSPKIRQKSSSTFKSWWCMIIVESGENFISKIFDEFAEDLALLLREKGFIGYCVIEVIVPNRWGTEYGRSTNIISLCPDSVNEIVLSEGFDKHPYPIIS